MRNAWVTSVIPHAVCYWTLKVKRDLSAKRPATTNALVLRQTCALLLQLLLEELWPTWFLSKTGTLRPWCMQARENKTPPLGNGSSAFTLRSLDQGNSEFAWVSNKCHPTCRSLLNFLSEEDTNPFGRSSSVRFFSDHSMRDLSAKRPATTNVLVLRQTCGLLRQLTLEELWPTWFLSKTGTWYHDVCRLEKTKHLP